MQSVMANSGVSVSRRFVGVSRAEYVVQAYFAYLSVAAFLRHLAWADRLWLIFPPILIFGAIRLEQAGSRPWSRILREYLGMAMILPSYWSVEWFATGAKRTDMQDLWVQWDRTLLHGLGLRAAIECLGGAGPFVLETFYMSLYAIPPIFLAILFLTGSRRRSHKFLFMLLLGTLTVYACLPFIPVNSPRVVYPGADLPQYSNWPRSFNTWLLDHMDISTSVFPSGHVAVAFSTAFGLLFAAPERKKLCWSAFGAALLVFAATIYGRYHYAVDGLVSILITTATWLAVKTFAGDSPDA